LQLWARIKRVRAKNTDHMTSDIGSRISESIVDTHMIKLELHDKANLFQNGGLFESTDKPNLFPDGGRFLQSIHSNLLLFDVTMLSHNLSIEYYYSQPRQASVYTIKTINSVKYLTFLILNMFCYWRCQL
jgi:hypothetical protein